MEIIPAVIGLAAVGVSVTLLLTHNDISPPPPNSGAFYMAPTRGSHHAVAAPSGGGLHKVASMQQIEAVPDAVAMVYRAGCHWCDETKPKFERAAQVARLPFLLVDSTALPMVMQKYQIRGVPEILRLRNGLVATRYKGDRSVEDLVKFAAS